MDVTDSNSDGEPMSVPTFEESIARGEATLSDVRELLADAEQLRQSPPTDTDAQIRDLQEIVSLQHEATQTFAPICTK